MTKSFQNYVELKKQAMKDIDADESDLENGQFDPSNDQENLSKFFEDVTLIKNDMEEITNLLLDLQDLKQEAKTTHSTAKILRGIRDRTNSDMFTILQKARNIKTRLESLDHSINAENSDNVSEGSHVDRTRMSDEWIESQTQRNDDRFPVSEGTDCGRQQTIGESSVVGRENRGGGVGELGKARDIEGNTEKFDRAALSVPRHGCVGGKTRGGYE